MLVRFLALWICIIVTSLHDAGVIGADVKAPHNECMEPMFHYMSGTLAIHGKTMADSITSLTARLGSLRKRVLYRWHYYSMAKCIAS